MPRNILFFCQSLAMGGDSTVLLETLKNWPSTDDRLTVALNAGHPGRDIFISASHGRWETKVLEEKTLEERKAEAVRSGESLLILQLSRIGLFFSYVRRLLRFLKQENPDWIILHAGGFPFSPLSWRLLCAAKLQGRAKTMIVVHGYPPPMRNPLRRCFLTVFMRLTPLLCDRMVAVSQHLADALGKAMGSTPPLCIHNGVGLPRAEESPEAKRKRLGVPPGPIIGAIGNTRWWKGYHNLLLAMPAILAEFPQVRLVIIGGPALNADYQKYLVKLAGEPRVKDNVFFMGALPEAGRFCACFDVCVIPSVQFESFGLAALDAMKYAKPVVATRLGGLLEVVEDGVTGLLVPPDDLPALAEAILRLLRSLDLRARMGENGYHRFMDRFTAEKMAARYHRLTVEAA